MADSVLNMESRLNMTLHLERDTGGEVMAAVPGYMTPFGVRLFIRASRR